MSLVTRGLGGAPLVVTAGLGESGFVIVETGCLISKSVSVTSQFSKTFDFSDASKALSETTEFPKTLTAETTIAKALSVSSQFNKTLRLCRGS